jgi:hypothetical protein
MASKNTKCSPTQSEKLSFITKTKSNSFPTALCEETSNPNASLKHTLSSPYSLSYTYTSVKDLIPCVESNSPLSQGGFCTIRSAEDIAISNVLVQKAAWLYLQPLPKTRTYFWGHIWNKLMNTCSKFINSNIVGKITHALDMVRRAIYVV